MKLYETVILSTQDPTALEQVVALLQAGELVAFPTDTVYGLACLPFEPASLHKIYEVKQRPEEKAIPVLVASLAQLDQIVHFSDQQILRLIGAFWPGPLTLVLPRKPGLPDELSPYPGIATRMPAHALALAILERVGPLAVTSANLSSHNNALNAQDVYHQLSSLIPLILDDGSTPGGSPSTVIDCQADQPILLRQGPIAFSDILEVWNKNGNNCQSLA